jgi:hypothetical protein
MRQELEAIREERMDRPDLSAIIRELIAEALAARKAKEYDQPSRRVPRGSFSKRLDPIKAAADRAEALSATKK